MCWLFYFSVQPTWVVIAVINAFRTWELKTHFTFRMVQDPKNADLTIGFYKGDHGDGYPFDGPGKLLAHAFRPQDGRVHFDGDENWSHGPVRGAYDLETTTLHEIGHLLGLRHSQVEMAIMYPSFRPGTSKGLNKDDINGIRDLYQR